MLIKYNEQSKSVIVNFIFFILKFPLSIISYKNIKLEILNYKKIKNSELFNKTILNNLLFFFIIIIYKGEKINRSHNKKFLNFYLDIFKNKNFQTFVVKKKIKLDNIKKFIKDYKPEFSNNFEKLIKDEIICTPAHGDLHYKNVILKNDKYYLIDWSLYNENSCYLFDVINYKIFSSKYYNLNWFDILNKHKKKFYKFIDKKYINLFIVWKINNELKFLNLTSFKIEKYKKNLSNFFLNLD